MYQHNPSTTTKIAQFCEVKVRHHFALQSANFWLDIIYASQPCHYLEVIEMLSDGDNMNMTAPRERNYKHGGSRSRMTSGNDLVHEFVFSSSFRRIFDFERGFVIAEIFL